MKINAGIRIRNATPKDFPQILNWIIEGARDGHYYEQPAEGTAGMLVQVHTTGTLTRFCERGIENIQAWLWVAELDNNLSGFILCSLEHPSSDSIELYKISTDKLRRRRGIATELAKHALDSFPETKRFIARCNKKSSWANSMLEKLGFRCVSISSSGQRTLELNR